MSAGKHIDNDASMKIYLLPMFKIPDTNMLSMTPIVFPDTASIPDSQDQTQELATPNVEDKTNIASFKLCINYKL